MPNWCATEINIYSSDRQKLEVLNKLIEEWTSKDFVENGFGHNWLGNVVGFSGIAGWDKEKDDFNKNIRCRGCLSGIYLYGDHLQVYTETAWAPMMQMWELICDKYLPDHEIMFTAEECGCGIYETNDPDVEGTYYLDIWDPPEEVKDEESVYEADEDYIIDFCQRFLGTEIDDLDKLLQMVKDSAIGFAIHKWEHCDIADCY